MTLHFVRKTGVHLMWVWRHSVERAFILGTLLERGAILHSGSTVDLTGAHELHTRWILFQMFW